MNALPMAPTATIKSNTMTSPTILSTRFIGGTFPGKDFG